MIGLKNTVYTIGYTSFDQSQFVQVLKELGINCVIDVRSVPASSQFPQYMLGHSLELHHVSDLRIYSVKSGEKLKTKADFILNNKRHERFAVTDPGYYMPEGDVFQIKDAYVVFSISDDKWARTYGHYKYIAAIYDLDIQPEPVAIDKTPDKNKLESYWSEGDVDYADLFCDELPELWHEEYGKGTILTLDENLVQVRFDTGIRKFASNILLKGKRISFESKEIIRIKSELFIVNEWIESMFCYIIWTHYIVLFTANISTIIKMRILLSTFQYGLG